MLSLLDFAAKINTEVLINEPMSKHTTFRIGGPADYFVTPQDTESLNALLTFCTDNGLSVFHLGNGSNLLVCDSGIRGVVITTAKLNSIALCANNIQCGAGAKLSDVCRFAADAGLEGLEFAYGIPGTVGGAVYMNAGAYGGEMKDAVTAVRHFSAGTAGEYIKKDLDFSYRKSAYTGSDKFITSVTLSLHTGDKAEINRKMDELLQRRKNRQPLEYPSAGSVFKRPVGHYAGTLIESCGLKGLRIGGAMVSEKHVGFIINTGGATCSDVKALIDKIKSEVLRQTGVTLESEIKIIDL
jgi:UDP-N-acetylmuramate dehydrogenase